MTVKFATVMGNSTLASKPFYVGIPQHERTMTKKETYAYCAERTGYKPTQVRAVFMALRQYLKENANRGNVTYIDGVASIRHYVKGAFEGLGGPWVKGKNYLLVQAVEMDPFKSLLADIIPVNDTEGATPRINTVLDEVTREYDVIVGTDAFSIAGADLAPDATKDDEYVAIVDDMGVETKAEITFSDLQNVKAAFETAPVPGNYTLVVHTRCGMGDAFGVKVASRKITIG